MAYFIRKFTYCTNNAHTETETEHSSHESNQCSVFSHAACYFFADLFPIRNFVSLSFNFVCYF